MPYQNLDYLSIDIYDNEEFLASYNLNKIFGYRVIKNNEDNFDSISEERREKISEIMRNMS